MTRLLSLLIATLLSSSCHRGRDVPVLVEGMHAELSLGSAGAEGASVRFLPDVPRVGEFFSLEGQLPSGARDVLFVHVDAAMPGHGHGMLSAPSTVLHMQGTFETSGMKLHMFGDWELVIEVRLADGTTEDWRRTFRYEPRGER